MRLPGLQGIWACCWSNTLCQHTGQASHVLVQGLPCSVSHSHDSHLLPLCVRICPCFCFKSTRWLQGNKHTLTRHTGPTFSQGSAPFRVLRNISELVRVCGLRRAEEFSHIQPGSASRDVGDNAKLPAVRSWVSGMPASLDIDIPH